MGKHIVDKPLDEYVASLLPIPDSIVNEKKRKIIREEKNETHTGNIMESYKELSSFHCLRKDNQGMLPLVCNVHLAG